MRKSRFTEAQIIGMIKEHEAGLPTSELCRKHGLSPATFYKLKAKYGGMACCRFRGHEDKIVTTELESGMTRRKFSREFKIEAVRLVTDRGVAVAQAARDLDVAESVLRRWMRELTATPTMAFPGNGQMRADLAEIAALKKEVARLRAERDILKKAAAFFAREAT